MWNTLYIESEFAVCAEAVRNSDSMGFVGHCSTGMSSKTLTAALQNPLAVRSVGHDSSIILELAGGKCFPRI